MGGPPAAGLVSAAPRPTAIVSSNPIIQCFLEYIADRPGHPGSKNMGDRPWSRVPHFVAVRTHQGQNMRASASECMFAVTVGGSALIGHRRLRTRHSRVGHTRNV